MNEEEYLKEEHWALINVLISAFIGAISALLVVYIQNRTEIKKERKEEYNAYKKYSKPIMFASESLAWRLREILSFNGAFLLPDAPMNGFFKYKFDSTVYRLSALLGWIRAAQKEQSYLEGFGDTKSEKVREAINNFQKVLADGSHVEVSVFEELCKLFNITPKEITDQTRQKIGVEIEKIVFNFIPDQIKKNASTIKKKDQLKMVESIMEFITETTDSPKVDKKAIKEKLEIAIDEIAREFCWIYRDWQSAIGDEMLIILNDSYRNFDVIGFSEFMTKHEQNKWLKKIDNLFSNLDVSIDNRFDTRVSQIKLIYIAIINLIEELNLTIEDEQAISNKGLETLKKFKSNLKSEK